MQPFAPLPLQALKVELEGIDPAAWWRGAPQAQLTLNVELAASSQEAFALTGPLRLRNTLTGPINRKRLPLHELSAMLTVDAQTLALTQMQTQVGRGRVSGTVHMQHHAPPRWQTDLRLEGIDLSQLHDRVRPLVVQGSVKAMNADSAAVQVQADLSTTGQAQLKLNFALNDQHLNLEQGHLQLGAGSLQVQGRLALRDTQAFALSGAVRNFNPALLLQLPSNAGATRLNGELNVAGQLQSPMQTRLRLNLNDSMALGQPLSGQVQLDIEPNDRLSVEANLAMQRARFSARGSLHATDPQQAVLVSLEAPDLAALHTNLRGNLTAQARLRGAWRAPTVDAHTTVSELRYGEHRVRSLNAQFSYSGGQDGDVALSLEAQGHQHPAGAALSLAHATLNAQGTLKQLRVDVAATTDKNITLSARAAGQNEKNIWHGTLEALQMHGPIAMALQNPAPLRWGSDQFSAGPLALSVNDGEVRDAYLALRTGEIETHGRFDKLAVPASANTGETPLTLRGHWSARVAQMMDATVHIERMSGDVYGGPTTGRVRMGLTALNMDATVRANRLNLSAALRGSDVGTVSAALNAEVQSHAASGWRLARMRPWSGELSAAAPSLAWINPFLSINLRDNIRVAGAADFKMQLSGTPQTPIARGHLNADALRLAWVEQGLRLDNGRLRARLEPSTSGGTDLIVDELTFTGTPRLRPKDARIQAALKTSDVGTLSASGKVKLPEFEGLLQVRSEKFPLLQRPDRWAIATGGANLVFSTEHMQLNGAAQLDAGYIDITQREAPTLSSDVIVTRQSAPPSPRSAPPRIALDFELGVDLGPAFIVHGAGLDTRVEGALQLKHTGRGLIRATGALETRDGVYEGYGQKLHIEHGRLNFQGPIDNPELDVLALRPGLPVEVGLTLTRSAANPRVRLHADPPMTDIETLSWLVLGRPADDTRNDNTALARAALGLLGGSGEGIPTQLARRLGLDEFSIRGAEGRSATSLLPRQSAAGRLRSTEPSTLSGEIVAIGKRLSDNLTLTYETATTGAGNTVQLSYQLTRRLALIGRAGTESTLDLVYGFAFD